MESPTIQKIARKTSKEFLQTADFKKKSIEASHQSYRNFLPNLETKGDGIRFGFPEAFTPPRNLIHRMDIINL
jgi:hypothetical protein